MYFKEWLIFIIAVSWGIDRYFGFREETGTGLWKFLKKNPLLITSLLIFGFIYLLDIMGGRFVWLAFLIGFAFMFTMIKCSTKKLMSKVKHLLGFGFILLCFFNVLLYTKYQLETNFHQPCWSPDGKQIAFFMGKNLIQYRFGLLGGWSPNPIWSKSYLCTMDYDGGNFKIIKQTEQATDEISWSGSGTIVYTQVVWQDVDTILQTKILYTTPDGKETGTLYETTKVPRKGFIPKENGRILDPWLSKDVKYLGFVLHFSKPKRETEEDIRLKRTYDNYEIIAKNMKTKKGGINILYNDMKFTDYSVFFLGSYNRNLILYKQNERFLEYDLDTQKRKDLNLKYEGVYTFFPPGYDIRLGSSAYSPDRSMYAIGSRVWTIDNKLVADYYIKPKRSYLFNIFVE